jgi:peptide/nickel transport system substrate-binding protein
VNQRVNNGQGIMGDFFFPPESRLYTEQPFSTYDPDEARRLVEEVKAETGWDGSFQLLTPIPTDYALAYQALFNNVGFNAQIDQVQSFLELVERTNLSSNFDVAIQVITTYETNVFQALSRSLSSDSRSNYSKFSSPQLDALFPQLRNAPNTDAMVDVLGQIGAVWLEQQPFVLTGVQPFSTVTGKNVGGIVTTVNGLVLFGEAFIA